jgi:hypothetical protein
VRVLALSLMASCKLQAKNDHQFHSYRTNNYSRINLIVLEPNSQIKKQCFKNTQQRPTTRYIEPGQVFRFGLINTLVCLIHNFREPRKSLASPDTRRSTFCNLNTTLRTGNGLYAILDTSAVIDSESSTVEIVCLPRFGSMPVVVGPGNSLGWKKKS